MKSDFAEQMQRAEEMARTHGSLIFPCGQPVAQQPQPERGPAPMMAAIVTFCHRPARQAVAEDIERMMLGDN